MRGKKDNRGGRPKSELGEVRSNRVTVRFSEKELEQVSGKAQLVGLEVSAFLREAALGRKVSVQASSFPVNVQTYDQLRRIGVNLNQLIRAVNSGAIVGIESENISELRNLVEKVGLEICGDRQAEER